MTAISVPMRTALPALIPRAATSGVVGVLAIGALAVMAWHSARSALGPSGALLLAADLVPFVAVLVTVGFLLTAPAFTGFTAYLAIALVVYVVGAIGIFTRATTLMPAAQPLWNACTIFSVFGFLPVAYLFPSGRFTPRWTRWLPLGWVAAAALALAFPWNPFPPIPLAFLSALGVVLVLSAIGAQVWRYRARSSPLERQQTKWLLLALGLQCAYFLAVMALPPNTVTNLGSQALSITLGTFSSLTTTGIVVAVGFAMLRYRLFEVDLVIARTLVYGALTAFILTCYVIVVGAVGLLWPAGTPLALPILATALAALGTEPLRRKLQRGVNRWLYGQRDEPIVVLSRLGDELAVVADLDDVLERIARTVFSTLRFPQVRATALVDGVVIWTACAGDPSADDDQAVIPLSFEAREVGRLYVTPRTGERFTVRDRDLLDRITPQAGIAIHAALVTEQLRRSRDEIVEAREQERRRLHRELHDGLGPMLSSLHQRIDLADRVLDAQPARAHTLLDGARSGLVSTLTEVRGIVDALRPALLEALGLIVAVTEAWAAEPRVSVTASSSPTLPAAVEVAAYRIVMEAIGNAVRHAGATRIEARLHVEDGTLVLEVLDDGCGGTTTARAGGGLHTMRERATELGGSLVITEGDPGTTITAHLPIDGSH